MTFRLAHELLFTAKTNGLLLMNLELTSVLVPIRYQLSPRLVDIRHTPRGEQDFRLLLIDISNV